MIKKYLLSILFSLAFLLTFSQKTIITGNANGANGKIIELIGYKDYFTLTEFVLASDTIDDNGNFELSYHSKRVEFAKLKIDIYASEIFLEKDAKYIITIHNLDQDFFILKDNPLFKIKDLQISINSSDSCELNKLIFNFNTDFDKMLIDHYKTFYLATDVVKMRKITDTLTTKYSVCENEYFKNYVKYRLALIHENMRIFPEMLFRFYFQDKPILHDHIEYVDYFKHYFENYIFQNSYKIRVHNLYPTINGKPNYIALLDTLGKDSLLRNEELRELVLLNDLKSLYYDEDFNPTNIIGLLQFAANNSKFKEHKIIAKNTIDQLMKLKPKFQADIINLVDLKGDTVNLTKFKKKYVYLLFFTPWNNDCIAEMDAMKNLYTKYGKEIEFISIGLANNSYEIINLVKEKKYNWRFAYFNQNYKILENYKVNSFPFFVLLDRDGKILQYPAKKPSEQVELIFMKLLSPQYNEDKDKPKIKYELGRY